MRLRHWLSLSLLFALLGSPMLAAAPQQEAAPAPSPEEAAMMAALEKARTPGPQHAALAEQAGSWKLTSKLWTDPQGEPTLWEGTAERTMTLGGRVLQERVLAELMGMPFEGIARTGFDNTTGEYWSTWTDSMSTGLAVLRGSFDEATGTLTFEGEVFDPMTSRDVKVRMVSKIGPGRETVDYFEQRGGGWVKTMELNYQKE